MQCSWRLGLVCARGCGGAVGGDVRVAGSSELRGLLAGVVVWEGVAGVVDADGDLARERKRGGHQEMCANAVKRKEQTGKVGGAYSRRSWRNTAASTRSPVRNGGGLGAWVGVGCAGIERGCRGLLIGAEKEGDRAIMAGIEGSPELLRCDGRGRDTGKKRRKAGILASVLTCGVHMLVTAKEK